MCQRLIFYFSICFMMIIVVSFTFYSIILQYENKGEHWITKNCAQFITDASVIFPSKTFVHKRPNLTRIRFHFLLIITCSTAINENSRQHSAAETRCIWIIETKQNKTSIVPHGVDLSK